MHDISWYKTLKGTNNNVTKRDLHTVRLKIDNPYKKSRILDYKEITFSITRKSLTLLFYDSSKFRILCLLIIKLFLDRQENISSFNLQSVA